MENVYIVSAVRTPIGRFGGAFKELSPAVLASKAMQAALERANIGGQHLDFFTFGNILRAGHGQLIPRQAAFEAGIPKSVNGYAVDMVCASGLMAAVNANLAIRAGEADLVLAGGVESMSQAGYFLSSKARWGYKYIAGNTEPIQDILFRDGLSDPDTGEAMGDLVERLAEELSITREALDEVAYLSQTRAAQATAAGIFKKEIVPIEVKTRKATLVVDVDEGIRADTTPESVAKLRPAFKKDGVLTAGNSSQISDGAAALVLASEAAVEKHGLSPIARIKGASWVAGEPYRFAQLPVPAVNKLVSKFGLNIDEFDLVENNEAFAINSVIFNRQLGIPNEKLNIHGGAIALGHPIGASGARIVVTLINALQQTGGKLGLASICHGTGGALAMAIELV